MVSLGIFSVVPPTEPCVLTSTQHLKVSTRDFSWGKGGRCFSLTTYHPCNAETSRQSGALIYPEPLGPPRPVAGRLYFFFLLYSLGIDPGTVRLVTQYLNHYAIPDPTHHLISIYLFIYYTWARHSTGLTIFMRYP